MTSAADLDRRFSVAPMMDWTDRHQRMLMRCITHRALLYTEMVTPTAAARDPERHLAHHPRERPLALQLGGADPKALAATARAAMAWGYDEVNLNMGCPSPRVGRGAFGAVLMKTPALATEGIAALADAVSVPVTVKLRIGVDDQDQPDRLFHLVDELRRAGAQAVVVHARKAWLQGLDPKQNREIPPLRYDVVLALKQHFPDLPVILNGGIENLEQAAFWIGPLDGVMVGRAAYRHPLRWLPLDRVLYHQRPPAEDIEAVLRAYRPYVEDELSRGTPLARMARHLLPLFQDRPGARKARQRLSEAMRRTDAGWDVVETALAALYEGTLKNPRAGDDKQRAQQGEDHDHDTR